jgi:hypothetical protein
MITGKRTRMFEEALKDSAEVSAAEIAVEKINGPILIISFKRDQIWPSPLKCDQIAKRLTDKNFKTYFEHSDYDGLHSAWTMEACHKNIIRFLNERFLLAPSK